MDTNWQWGNAPFSSNSNFTTFFSFLQSLLQRYQSGGLRVFHLKDQRSVSFVGHSSTITSLVIDASNAFLASGSQDTEIVVWDLIAEKGLYRLRGHKNAVTDLHFIQSASTLISSSSDTFLKVWDLETRHCVQTVTGEGG